MNHITHPRQILETIEMPSYELHTRPTADNDRKLNVFFGSRLIGYIHITHSQDQSNFVGTTLKHQSFGPFSQESKAAEAVLEAFNVGLTDEQRAMVTLANEIAENMNGIAD